MRLSVSVRAMQIATCSIAPLFVLTAVLLTLFALAGPIDEMQGGVRSIRQLQAQEAQPPPAEIMDAEDRRAREILIAGMPSNFLTASFVNQLDPAQREVRERAIALHPSPSAEELAWARDRFREHPLQPRDANATQARRSELEHG
jgi:hypothetical protein